MKRASLWMLISLALAAGCMDLSTLSSGGSSATGQAVSLSSLSQEQMAAGLREALQKGLQQAVAELGRENGFLGNASVKIPMPAQMQKIESTLRTLRQDKLADDFVATMNHAAEQAVPEATSVFVDAVSQMTIADAKSILTGPDDAATQYFRKTSSARLHERFLPIVQQATAKAGVTGAYKKVTAAVNAAESGRHLADSWAILGRNWGRWILTPT